MGDAPAGRAARRRAIGGRWAVAVVDGRCHIEYLQREQGPVCGVLRATPGWSSAVAADQSACGDSQSVGSTASGALHAHRRSWSQRAGAWLVEVLATAIALATRPDAAA